MLATTNHRLHRSPLRPRFKAALHSVQRPKERPVVHGSWHAVMSSSSIPSKKPINLLRGWPAPSLLPVSHLQAASQRLLSGDSQQVTPALCYGPDLGYGPLLESLAVWLVSFYHGPENGVVPDPARLCITGGASQSIACILQSFTDPVYTLRVWMAAPCYFLACPIFNDSGFARRLRAVREDEDGMDVRWLKEEMERVEREEQKKGGSGTPVCSEGSSAHPYSRRQEPSANLAHRI